MRTGVWALCACLVWVVGCDGGGVALAPPDAEAGAAGAPYVPPVGGQSGEQAVSGAGGAPVAVAGAGQGDAGSRPTGGTSAGSGGDPVASGGGGAGGIGSASGSGSAGAASTCFDGDPQTYGTCTYHLRSCTGTTAIDYVTTDGATFTCPTISNCTSAVIALQEHCTAGAGGSGGTTGGISGSGGAPVDDPACGGADQYSNPDKGLCCPALLAKYLAGPCWPQSLPWQSCAAACLPGKNVACPTNGPPLCVWDTVEQCNKCG
jgi:hypothetical protein